MHLPYSWNYLQLIEKKKRKNKEEKNVAYVWTELEANEPQEAADSLIYQNTLTTV